MFIYIGVLIQSEVKIAMVWCLFYISVLVRVPKNFATRCLWRMLQGNILGLSGLWCLNSSQIWLATPFLEPYIFLPESIVTLANWSPRLPKLQKVSFAFTNINWPVAVPCKLFTNINLLKPTGHVMHQQFNIQPTLYLCVLYLSENKQRLVPLTA